MPARFGPATARRGDCRAVHSAPEPFTQRGHERPGERARRGRLARSRRGARARGRATALGLGVLVTAVRLSFALFWRIWWMLLAWLAPDKPPAEPPPLPLIDDEDSDD